MEFLNKLCCTNGCSGNEKAVASLIAEYVKEFVDEICYDALGNLIVRKKGNGKKLMFVAHMDEVGFITTISKENNIKVASVGEFDVKCANNHLISFQNGCTGVLSAEKPEKVSDYGVELFSEYADLTGITAVYYDNYKIIENNIISKSLSSRACCYCLTQLIKNCKSELDLYFVFTVKKNIGMKGAKVAGFDINPDYAIVLDGVKADKPSVVAKDKYYIVDNNLKKLLNDCGFDIKVDKELVTEAGVLQVTGNGIKTAAVGLNVKHINHPNEVCKISDINDVVSYLTKFIEKGKEL